MYKICAQPKPCPKTDLLTYGQVSEPHTVQPKARYAMKLQLQITNQLNTLKMSLIHMFCDVDGPWIVLVSYLEQKPCPMAMEELAKFPFPENSSAMAFVMVTRYHSYIT